jgi:pimeloyl-ACP methyl ester carboxylesterase
MKRPGSRRARSLFSLLATVTAAASVLAVAVSPASAGREGSSSLSASKRKPTVVLVHGAFADSSSWNAVVKRLRREGYPVVAVANPLRGLSSDAGYLKEVLAGIEGPVVLAGHSYGGSVISNASHGAKNVRALVYIGAFLPEKGESAAELSGKFPGSTLGAALRPVPVTLPNGTAGTDLYIEPGRFRSQFAADVAKDTAEVMGVTQRPVTSAALEEGASEPGWKTIPSWVLVTGQDLNIPPETQRFMAERAGAHTVEVRASHAVSVSRPDEVARVIESAARPVR